jgi:formate hydrogenlyase transcriptional activator
MGTSEDQPAQIAGQDISADEFGIKQGEERFRSLFENSIDAVLLSTPGGTVEAANPAACRLFGRSVEEICGIAGFGLVDPSDSRLQSLLEERERTGRFRGELFYKRKDGSTFLGEVSSALYQDHSGKTKAAVIIRDITDRKRVEETLRHITEGTAGSTGDEFFRSLVKHLAHALQVRYSFVAECTDETKKNVRMLAFWQGEDFGKNIEFPLAGTPCESVIQGNACSYPERLQVLFPEDEGLVTLGAQSYAGVPLINAAGNILGHLVVMDDNPRVFSEQAFSFLRIFATRACAELERARAHKELQFLNAELGVLLDINRAVGRYLDRDKLFGAVASCLKTLVPTERFGLEFPMEGGQLQGHILSRMPTDGEQTHPTLLPAAGTACDWVMQNRVWFVAASRDEFRERFPVTFDVITSKGMESLCALPLISGGHARGALYFMAAAKGAYGQLRREFLEQVASQIAIAVENMKSYEEIAALNATVATSAQRRQALLNINNAIVTKLTRDELLSAVCDALAKVIRFDRLALSLYDLDAGALRIVTYAGSYRRQDYTPVGRVLDLKDSPAGLAFLNQKPLLRRNLEKERQTSSEERAFGHGFKSLCALPLIVRGKSIGAITVGSLAKDQYTEADAEFLMEVANQIAIAFDNMKSYEEIAALNATIGATAERRQTLLDINNAIISNLTQETLFRAIAQALRRVVPFDRMALFLHDPQRDVLRLFTLESSLPGERYVVGLEWPPGESHAGWSFQNQQCLVRNDLEKERRYATEDLLLADGVCSLVVVPLVARGVSIGTLNLNSVTPGRYSESDALFLQEVANQVALAVENMKAYEEIAGLKVRLEAENVYLQEEIKTEYNFDEIIGRSPSLRQLLRNVEQVAPTEATVLIQGETGTGKELVARAVHDRSRRKDHPLVKVNCGSIPAGLVESELFGHEKGAFTGATQRRAGRFELANGGTIFLDEVTELPVDTQVKLLRVLQEGEFERVGSSQTIKVDVRVIAATNRDLKEVVKNGTFRSDLFYRLNVFPLAVPALRERKDDIPLLVNFFLSKFGKKLGKEVGGVSQRSMDSLLNYDWPGNVRELQNIVERAVVLASGPIVHVDDSMMRSGEVGSESTLDTLGNAERNHILRALNQTHWVIHGKKGAAEILGINPSTLRSRMEKLGIRKRGQI